MRVWCLLFCCYYNLTIKLQANWLLHAFIKKSFGHNLLTRIIKDEISERDAKHQVSFELHTYTHVLDPILNIVSVKISTSVFGIACTECILPIDMSTNNAGTTVGWTIVAPHRVVVLVTIALFKNRSSCIAVALTHGPAKV